MYGVVPAAGVAIVLVATYMLVILSTDISWFHALAPDTALKMSVMRVWAILKSIGDIGTTYKS